MKTEAKGKNVKIKTKITRSSFFTEEGLWNL